MGKRFGNFQPKNNSFEMYSEREGEGEREKERGSSGFSKIGTLGGIIFGASKKT